MTDILSEANELQALVERTVPADAIAKRASVRGPMRDAKARAAELRQHFSDNPTGVDTFDCRRLEPEGWSYEWKRKTVYNKEDPTYATTVARAGWDPVPAGRHPELTPPNHNGGTIERDGLVLCERPTEIVQEARNRDLAEARAQVRSRETVLREETPKGGAPRNHAKVGVTYGRDGIRVDE